MRENGGSDSRLEDRAGLAELVQLRGDLHSCLFTWLFVKMPPQFCEKV